MRLLPRSVVPSCVGVACVAVLALGGCSSGDGGAGAERVATDRGAIQDGVTDTSHAFAVGIWTGNGLCSGAIIAPNLVITARHCVAQVPTASVDCATDKFGANHAASVFGVTTDAQMSQRGKFYGVTKVVTPTDTHFCGNDIALLVLDTNIPSTVAKPVVPAVEYSMTDHTHYDITIDAIGYGVTSVGGSGAGVRRIKEGISIQCIPGDKQIPCPTNESSITANEFVTGAGTCSGDSGSSAFEKRSLDRGAPVSLGVLSRGGESGDQCLDAIYTRTDVFNDLIIATAVEAASAGGYPPPSWTNAVSPASGGGGAPEAAGGLGAPCDKDDACSSKMCAADGDNFVCVTRCDTSSATSCPDGFRCTAAGDTGLCFAGPAPSQPNAAQSTTTTTGCAVSPSSSTTGNGNTLLGFGLAAMSLAAVRRRRGRRG